MIYDENFELQKKIALDLGTRKDTLFLKKKSKNMNFNELTTNSASIWKNTGDETLAMLHMQVFDILPGFLPVNVT